MGKKNVNELEEQLKRMKEREAQLREELQIQRKVADAKAQKERCKKMCQLMSIVIEETDNENILNNPDGWRTFIQKNLRDLKMQEVENTNYEDIDNSVETEPEINIFSINTFND